LFRETKLSEPPLAVGERAFEGVVGPSCVMILEKLGAPAGSVKWEPIKADGILTPTGAAQVDSTGNEEARAIINKMKRFPLLPPKAFADPGVHTGNSADILLLNTPEPCSQPLLVGRDVVRFFVGNPRLWLNIPARCPNDHYYRIARPDRYANAAILIRQTASHPIAARNTHSCYFRNSLLACYGCDGFSTEYLLAILNSSLVRFFHQHEYRDGRQQAFPQVKVGHLRSIPIPPPDDAVTEKLTELVRRMEELASGGAGSETAAIDGSIDELVYTLYGLTEEERQLVVRLAGPSGKRKSRGQTTPAR